MNFTQMLSGVRNPQLRAVLEEMDSRIVNVNTALASGVAGDLIYSVTPATLNTEISDQNVGTKQVATGTVSGLVAAAGAGDIIVTVHSAELEGGSKPVTVTLANDNDANAIALAIRTALAADEDISDSGSALFTISGSTSAVILTRNVEAANDPTVSLTVSLPETGEAEFVSGSEVAIAVAQTTPGVAPYTREVTIKLVDSLGNVHTWFTDNIALTIVDNAAGAASLSGVDKDGAPVAGDTNYGMFNGVCTVTVTLQGTWANTNTNTVTASQKTILGATVTAKTSAETSVDT